MTDSPKFLRAKDLSALIDVPEETLSKWRQLGSGPTYYRLPGGRVRYVKAEVDAWLDSIKVNPKP